MAGGRGQQIDSVWAASAAPGPQASVLEGEAQADVAIVGAGFTGLSAALHLAEAGVRVLVLEAAGIGHGGSGRNVGLLNAGLWLAPDDVEARLGEAAGRRLNAALMDSPEVVFDLIERHQIGCEVVRRGTLHLAYAPGDVEVLHARAAQMAARGREMTVLGRDETAERTGTTLYHGALFDPGAGTINPLAYARGLARAAVTAGARLHADSPATALERDGEGWRLTTPKGAAWARTVILATNAYTDALCPGLARTIVPISFFQFATPALGSNLRKTILPGGEGAWDTGKVMIAFRLDRSGRFVLGSIGDLPQRGGGLQRRWAKRMAGRLFPQLGEQPWEHAWSGRIAFTPDHLPRLCVPAPGLIAPIGYNGRGIGPGTIFGRAIARYFTHGDRDSLPLTVVRPEPVAFRGLRAAYMEAGARLWHLGQGRF